MWFAVLAAELLALGCAVELAAGVPSRWLRRLLNRLGIRRFACVVAPRGGDVAEQHRNKAFAIVALLAFAVVVDVLLAVGDCRVLGDPRAALAVVVPCVPPAPRGGLASAVVLAEQALAMAWPVALAAVTWAVFMPRLTGGQLSTSGPRFRRQIRERSHVFACAWLFAVAVLVFGRPYGHPGASLEAREARAAFVADLLLVVELVSVAAGAVAVARAWGRPWGRSPVHAAVLALLATELFVATIGPFVRDPFGDDWGYARALYVMGFVAVAWVLRPRRAGRLAAPP